MDSPVYAKEETKEHLLEAQAHIWSHVFYFLKSMALKCAIELRIPDTIHKHGKPMTLKELANSLPILPNKITSLSRLMRLLVSSKFFSIKTLLNGEEGFALTLSSQLLLKDHPLSQAPFSLTTLSFLTEQSSHLSNWFQSEVEYESPYQIAHGRKFWEHARHEPLLSEYFNSAMESDSRLVTSLLVTNKQFMGLLDGVDTLVDVGGGNGTTAKAISEAYPSMVCTVLELPHVVDGLQGNDNNGNVIYVAGNMFMKVPLADAVLLKWILHDWSDNECIKILKQCKEAIPSKSQGGKVIIIDIVVEPQIKNSKHSNAQVLFDIEMMSLFGEGKERTEEECKKRTVC
ncbi:trans-resveratrol di-O-methyltransferase-like [Chenopodium quinoa]|uniref:trans-resveratrol di-O-methyltransferase-like n=1 Tax=Chenopodium quinoa TaxID=63459 RepID=UPI000B783851|nr:trans-resveratrol di-O-methyltransferase-like [Chenopodium quinoa]